MGHEVTRASSEDRDRYYNHIPELFTQGRITEEEMCHMLELVLKARTLHQLDDMLEGLPKPEPAPMPRLPRDWGIPRNFLPPCLAATLFGLTLAVGPSAVLSGPDDGSLGSIVVALSMLWGIWITVVAVVTMIIAGFTWDDQDSFDKQERRRKDSQGR